MIYDLSMTPKDLLPNLERFWQVSAEKIENLQKNYDPSNGSPVYTWDGKYTTRGWTEWTQGFQYGSEILQFDATGDTSFLESGRKNTVDHMAPHLSHFGVHDHGFNNISTYGNLLRLMNEGKIPENEWERNFYEVALKVSGAAQARRWTNIANGEGYIYSFNGPQSLFADTIRSLRSLAVGYQLGHPLMEEHDTAISLLDRLVQHARTTATYSIFYGEGRDAFDIRGRTAHESLFNVNDGNFRAPNSQQGFSPFTTWTRGLAWCVAGYPEQLEFLATLEDSELEPYGGREDIEGFCKKAASAVCDFYIGHTTKDGIPFWDTGAPNLHKVGDYTQQISDPYNPHEAVDSSSAAIASQGLIRYGRYLGGDAGETYIQAGLTALNTILEEPYLSTDPEHQGLILHSNYHLPNGWDQIHEGQSVVNGESCMWGDYHAREAALYVQRLANDEPYYKFYLDKENT